MLVLRDVWITKIQCTSLAENAVRLGNVRVQAVANAAVPIVKMVDGRGSGLHVDICFNNMLGVANTRCARRSALHGAHVVGSSSSITVQYLFILDS